MSHKYIQVCTVQKKFFNDRNIFLYLYHSIRIHNVETFNSNICIYTYTTIIIYSILLVWLKSMRIWEFTEHESLLIAQQNQKANANKTILKRVLWHHDLCAAAAAATLCSGGKKQRPQQYLGKLFTHTHPYIHTQTYMHTLSHSSFLIHTHTHTLTPHYKSYRLVHTSNIPVQIQRQVIYLYMFILYLTSFFKGHSLYDIVLFFYSILSA